MIAAVKTAAPLVLPTLRGSRARNAAYSGQLAIAITQAASKASMKPCTIQTRERNDCGGEDASGRGLEVHGAGHVRARPRRAVVSDRSRFASALQSRALSRPKSTFR